MYEGAIGTLNIEPVHFELKPNATPFHAKLFPIPKAYEHLTKEECKRFDVRVVTDFRELNKWIVRKPYPLPKIPDILQKMERFKYATVVDLRKDIIISLLTKRPRNCVQQSFLGVNTAMRGYLWVKPHHRTFFKKP